MKREQTYYDVLQVRPSAGPEEIRASYIRLMKAFHPDRSGSANSAPNIPDLAKINACYAVLKDPAKRVVYDADLVRSAVPVKSVTRLSAGSHRRPRVRAFAVQLLLLAAAVIALGLIGELALTINRTGDAAAESTLEEPSAERPLTATPQQINRQVAAALASTATRAVNLSRNCYDAARKSENVDDVELCVIFDEAALYAPWSSLWDGPPSSYFQVDMVRQRQEAALAPFYVDATVRASALRRETYRAVVGSVSRDIERVVSTSDPGPLPPLTGPEWDSSLR